MTSSHPRSPAGRRLRRLFLLVAVPAAALAGGAYLYLHGGRVVETDNAYVQQTKLMISAEVSGQLASIAVRENQTVKPGDLLFTLDDRSFRAAVDRAEADLAAARLNIRALQASVRAKQAEIRTAQDTLAYQSKEMGRQQRLVAADAGAQTALDAARHQQDVARGQVAALEQQLQNLLAQLGGQPDGDVERHPLVEEARAALARARIDLDHTVIRAPASGILAKVDQVSPGAHVSAGAAMFALIADDRTWVEANFKETDLTYMQVGQAATVVVDAYPDLTFKGHVESVSPGAGNIFSLLPAQNATGNWVKVVQRVPVRVVLDGADSAHPLRAGMSVTAEVDTGHERQLFGGIRTALAATDKH